MENHIMLNFCLFYILTLVGCGSPKFETSARPTSSPLKDSIGFHLGFTRDINNEVLVGINAKSLPYYRVGDTLQAICPNGNFYYKITSVFEDTDGLSNIIGGDYVQDDTVSLIYITHGVRGVFAGVGFHDDFVLTKQFLAYSLSNLRYICIPKTSKIERCFIEQFSFEKYKIDLFDSVISDIGDGKEVFKVTSFMKFTQKEESKENHVFIIDKQNEYSRTIDLYRISKVNSKEKVEKLDSVVVSIGQY